MRKESPIAISLYGYVLLGSGSGTLLLNSIFIMLSLMCYVFIIDIKKESRKDSLRDFSSMETYIVYSFFYAGEISHI